MMTRRSLFASSAMALSAASAPSARPLFNGNNLDGWVEDTPNVWQARDGMIAGRHSGQKWNDFHDDQLGGLSLTREGLYMRDRLVFDTALQRRIPVVVTLAGGYARRLQDTVELHAATARAALESIQEWSQEWKS